MSRTRTRIPIPETMYPSCSTRYVVTDKDGVVKTDVTYPQVSGLLSTSSQTTVDVVTPNFKQRIANGEIINNPYSNETLTWTYPDATSFYRYAAPKDANSDSFLWTGKCAADPLILPALLWLEDFPERNSIYSSIMSSAVQQAYANMDQSEMLALATAAESRDTVDFFVDTGRRLFKIIKAAKKLDLKRLKRELSAKELANRYMELRYAVRPLIGDVENVLASLEKLSKTYDRHTARGFATAKLSATRTIPNVSIQWGLKCDILQEATFTYEVRAGVLSHVRINELQVFGVDQLLSTAWELLPFSFIVDWFVNVGGAVAALSPKAGITQLASWATETTKVSSTGRAVNYVGDLPSYGSQTTYWDVNYARTYYRRARVVDPDVQYFPETDVFLDMYKILDLGIILKGLVKGR